MTALVLLTRIINAVTGVIAFILGLYILLRLIGASTSAPVIAWFYGLAQGLSAPFRGIFPDLHLSGASTLDMSALIAAIVYALVGYLIIAFLTSVFGAARTTTHTHTAHTVED